MILHTRAAKVILLMLALWLAGCAAYIAITGWTGEPTEVSTSAAESAPAQPPNQAVPPETVASVEPTPTPVADPVPTPSSPPVELLPPQQSATIPEKNAVYLSPAELQARPGEEVSLNVMVSLQNKGVSGCEWVLSFPPSVFEVSSVKAGDLLGKSPLIGAEEKDNQAGTIHFAVARKGPTDVTDTTGVVAVVTLRALSAAEGGVYGIALSDVELTDERFREVQRLQVQDAWIQVVR